MTAKAAMIKALLLGKTINIKTGFEMFGITNVPREISLLIRKEGILISKTKKEGESRWKVPVMWFEYKLNPLLECNKEPVKKLAKYVLEKEGPPKTNEQAREQERIKRLLSL